MQHCCKRGGQTDQVPRTTSGAAQAKPRLLCQTNSPGDWCLGGMRPTLLSSIKAIPACERSAISLLGQMQKAVILGSLRLLRANDLWMTDQA
ncbi:hypothetical protein LSTR_LSTR000562 [Laodelphax striatellus]|uniref:Uncharacterized protein n=1 Tax=Laodelphax striatellus TaxID=195883 RepID=A0A482XB74_LAOST|nr:hypothetical protein LSTR_LSTR000562 [Laodelphax striatellus]